MEMFSESLTHFREVVLRAENEHFATEIQERGKQLLRHCHAWEIYPFRHLYVRAVLQLPCSNDATPATTALVAKILQCRFG